MRIGLISDTHGLLRAEAKEWLKGCDSILHGGDIGTGIILDELRSIAPVTAVRGNTDTDATVAQLPEQITLILDGVRVLILHDRHELRLGNVDPDLDVIVSGLPIGRASKRRPPSCSSIRAVPAGAAFSCRSRWANC